MGQTTTRITAQDFLTPPELADYRLAAEGAGRIGGVRLTLEGRPTRLASSYQQVPLRVLAPALGAFEPALVYLLNPTAGLFDGDAQHVSLHAEPGSRAVVTGQSATRIHPCLKGFSTQQWQIRVEQGAILVILPGPALPFAGCRYYQRVAVDLAPGAHFIWSDVWLPGRYARGNLSERFAFQTLIQDLTVRQEGRLIFRDRFCWQGPWDEDTARWHFAGMDAYGTLFTTICGVDDLTPMDERIRGARFQTAHNHMCWRWLGSTQAVTSTLTHRALTLAAQADGRTHPWLLAGHDLAPNHWFSTELLTVPSPVRGGSE